MKFPRKTSNGKLAKQNKITRLYVKGTVLGYKRGQNNQYPNTSLVKIQGVDTKEEVDFYLGKKMAYVYRAQTAKNGSKFRVIWGKVRRAHGVKGVVRCRFTHNLPPKSFGARVRVMLYPSNI